jgi:[NiFe] hydrogenase assembly HybE family chaperone
MDRQCIDAMDVEPGYLSRPGTGLADAKSGEKLGLQLPYGEMMFTVGELDGISQYCACSLMSPLAPDLSVEQGEALARDCLRMVLSLPVRDPQISRRALFAGLKGGEYA